MAAANPPPVMNPMQQDPLAELRDIHLPDPVSWFPPAPGWWLLALLGAVLVVYLVRLAWQRWQAGAYRREALRRLDELAGSNTNPHQFVTELNTLLKKVALAQWPREDVAPLTGEAWVAFLDRTANTSDFRMGAGEALIDMPYRPTAEVDRDALVNASRQWIRTHRREAA